MAELVAEGRLKLVGPSDELKRAYFRKSEGYLASAKLLLDNGRIEEPVSLAYYSMYYSLLALLFRVGVKCQNHAAAIFLLGEVFEVDSSEITKAKRERIDKQYFIDFSLAREDVAELVGLAEKFNAKLLDFTDRSNSEAISKFRDKIEGLLDGL